MSPLAYSLLGLAVFLFVGGGLLFLYDMRRF